MDGLENGEPVGTLQSEHFEDIKPEILEFVRKEINEVEVL